ncbi:hypothetical protein J4Q44_G00048460 [Coregonus suidteri]|uniref:Ubiquitin-like protease family profile domain-containing protein n=1 Tax=Coregonus suidteri TaxID=861788 RepID=A0AAN8R6Q6_9TELE
MAAPFKIPKRKQPPEADSMHMQSPLSRVQDTSRPFETSWCNGSSNGKKPEQVGSLNGHISRAGKVSAHNRLVLRDVCKAGLGPSHPDKGNSSQSTGFQRPAQTPEHRPVTSQRGDSSEHSKWREAHRSSTLWRSPPRFQLAVNRTPRKQMESLTHEKPPHLSSPVASVHKAEQRLPAASPSCLKNGWRPKRASDTLCRDKNQASPLLKMRRAEFTGDSQLSVRCSPVESSEDSASEPSPEREADSSSKMGDRPSVPLGDPTWRRRDSGVNGSPPQNTEKERTGSSGSLQDRIKRSSGSSGTHPRGSVPVPAGHRSQSSESDNPPDRPLTSGARGASTGSPRLSPSAVASVTPATQEKRLSLSRSPLPANPNLTDRERRPPTKCLSLHLRLRRPKPTTTEPIVLSSEDEEGHDDEEECPRLKTPQQGHSPRQSQPTPEEHVPKQLAVNRTPRKQMESLTHEKPPHLSSPVASVHKAEQRLPAASPSCLKNGWRPKRASDTLCRDKNQASPLLKMRRAEFTGDSQLSVRCSPVESSEDSASEPSPEREADSSSKMGDRPSVPLGDPTWRRRDSGVNGSPPQNTEKERTGSSGSLQDRIKRSSGSSGTHPRGSVPVPAGHRSQSSESDDPPDRPLTSGARGASTGSPRHSPSAVASVTRATQEKRLSLSRSPLPANPNLTDRERRPPTKCLSLHLRLRRPKPTSTEPIVLSSEDEEGHDDEEECPRLKTPQQGHSPRQSQPTPEEHVPKQAVVGEKVTGSQRVSEHNPCSTQPLPPIMELSFSTLHAGVVRAQANGNLVVTDDGITLPLKDSRVSSEEEGGVSVSLVASQLRGYAVWDGGLAQDGSLFQGCPGRVAPSLLFLWVSEAQANLVQTELSALHPVTLPGQACPFLLLVLREQLGDLQAALLASMLDVEAFRQGRSYDLKSPLSWADGLALIHSCPQDAHFLTLLGQSLVADPNPGLGTAKGSPSRTRGNHRSRERYSRHQGLLPTRLIQYPPLPSKGGITVTTEDLDCLDSGQFLNDVIIDFYLKYLLLERAPGPLAERCHVFSSFFYKQLTRRDTSLEEEAAIPARDRRHQRVRTWTRHVDIFNKDYLFVPVNHQAHWYLVVICFPGLEQAQHEEWSGPAGVEASGGKRKCQPQASAGPSPGPSNPKLQNGTGGTGEARGKPTLRPHNPPECTQDGCQKETIIKKHCILIMDSLKISNHESIYKLLQDYLHVEWEVRRGTRRDFTVDSMKASHCRVPLQDNSSDCGLYLLQYVESFLQNPVVHFDLPLRLERWFPRQQVWRKREEIRSLVMELHGRQGNGESSSRQT